MVVFFIDADNFSSPIWIDEAFRWLEATESSIAVRRAYGSAENLKGLSDTLRHWAVRPFVNLPLSKNTTDLSLAVDAMELACQSPRPTLFVIGSGDVDFVPLVVRLRERGIRIVCVSERSKMAQDAVRAYDQVIYVGEAQAVWPAVKVEPDVIPPVISQVPVVPVRPAAKTPTVKTIPHKVASAKTAAAKKIAKKTPIAKSESLGISQILAVVPNLKTGEWQPLGDVAKILHDGKLLAKNATSTKLFNKFLNHFELTPAKQPNRVRYILPPK
jgi:NYN domain